VRGSDVAWRRRREQQAATTDDETLDAHDHPVADDAVLDELSRVFAADDVEAVVVRGPADPSVAAPGGDGSSSGSSDLSSGSSDLSSGSAEPTDSSLEPSSTSAERRGTISIVADDLPDVAYLDDELDREDSSGPVFIDDDGSSDAVLPRDASTRGIEPRIRQRRIGVKRAENRRRLWWVALAVVVVAAGVAVLALLGSSLFAVDQVTVTGNVYTDPDQLQTIVDDLIGTPVLRVDTAEIEARVEAIAWVDDARVRTSFPDSASIDIRERTPIATMAGADGRYRVIDVDGRVLSVVDGQPVAPLLISGPGTLDLSPGEFAPIGYSAGASFVTKLTPEVRSRVESMLVTADGADLVLVLTSDRGPIEVRFGSAIGENAQIEKLVRLQRTLDDIGTKPVTVIDVSTSEVTVR
jgi:cell division septal protein FtsQ